MGLLDILQQAIGHDDATAHLDQVAQHASAGELGAGLAAAMRSDGTPPFGDTVGQLFGRSSSAQQAGVLNQILATLGPAAASALAGGVLGRMLQPGQTQVTPDQASQLSPAQVTEIATHAEQQHAGVIDEVSRFYAQHSGLIKTLGGAAIAIALAKMKENATRG
ncbi:hypothetical protein [Variovorax paradoxus]|uniref:DUF937 domain-containing protein n=1 Tax=Variovorax paradoxus TaxID=34073 RepID=A0A679J899_VARPD|nr:hypothetical protein VVAX_05257 [Variovorax paradoxus]